MSEENQRQIEDRLAETAAGWVARLQSSDASDRDRAKFESWLAADPSHAAAYQEMSDLWSDLKDVPLARPRPRRIGMSRRAAIGNALALCLIAGLSLMLYQMGLIDRLRADYYTTIGEVRTVTLEDGTIVDLNTDTAIMVNYVRGARRIELLRGEAFFDVTKDAGRPFIVTTDLLSATALGTRYAVQAESAGMSSRVQVEEGRVEVRTDDDVTILEAGDVATLDDAVGLNVAKADVSQQTAWRTGRLVFSGQPLREVLASLARYRNGRIIVVDDRAANQRVSGIFDLRDTDQALRVLEDSLPVTVSRLTDMLVIVRSR